MVRRLPPLTALRAFESAARLGSFTAAADELAVTPAAISHQVKGLEDLLGVPLFVRLPRGLRLTQEGTAYLPELSRGFDQLARAGDRLRDSALRGRIHISALPSLAHCWLIPRLPRFKARYPDIDLMITGGEQQADFLRDGVDIGLRYGMGYYPSLHVEQVMTEWAFPACSPALLSGPHPPRTWADLRHHTLLQDHCASVHEPWITWGPWLRAAGVQEAVSLERGLFIDNSATMLEACAQGQGVMIARSGIAAGYLREGRLVPLFGARRTADFAYYAVVPEANAQQPRLRAFIDWVVEEGRASMAALPESSLS